MKRILFLFFTGSIVYPAIEIAWRGKTHVSMSLAGGTCLCLLDKFCTHGHHRKDWIRQCATGSGIITAVEFIMGICVNKIGKCDVWNYSKMPFNFLGQICIPFSIGWFFLSAPAIGFCKLCRRSRHFSS